MQNDMVERYIYAVTKRLPRKIRADVEQELRSLIVDMLEERCDGLPPTERDVRIVLTELGTPDELAKQYNPSAERSLIGPHYYPSYIKLLKLILPIVAGSLLLAGAIINLLEPAESSYFAVLWEWLLIIINVEVFLFAAFTILFVIFEKRGIRFDMDEEESLSSLPPVPVKEESISRAEPIIGIVFTIIFTLIFLLAPQILGWSFESGVHTPMLNTAAIRSVWYIVVLFALLGLVKETFRLYERRLTKRVALVTIICDVLCIPLVFIFFNNGWKMTPEFLSGISSFFGEDGAFLTRLFSNFGTIFLALMLFALALSIGTTAYKMIKTKK